MSFLKKIEKLQTHLLADKVDFLLINDPVNLLYLTGLNLENAKLIVGQTSCRLFVDKRFIEAAQKKSSLTVMLLEEEAFSDFFLVHSSKEIVKVAFDANAFSYNDYRNFKDFLKKLEKQANKNISFEITPKEHPLRDIRAIKTPGEIVLMKKAAEINWKGFEYICSILTEGITEKAVALEYEMFCKKNGASELSFPPIIAFGTNSAMPHHESDDTRLKKDDIVLIDIGASVNNYNSDMTRTIFYGNHDPFLEKLYSTIRQAHNMALEQCKPGTKIGELDRIVREFFDKEGFGPDFLHSLGHGVGLSVHEFPGIKFDGKDKDTSLKTGMVITIEPGLYKPEIGGVRYEDTILITKEGYENFYTSF